MKPLLTCNLRRPLRSVRRLTLRAGLGVLFCLGSSALAKEAPLNAIELFDGPSGPSYVQITDVLINGKTILRGCGASATEPIDKSAYGKLSKVALTAGSILDRGQDGVLRLTSGAGEAGCVVPDNLKFEHGTSLSPAALGDMADLSGRSLGSVSPVPQIKKGVKIVFTPGPDLELAEFLLAQLVGDIHGWQNYLSKYPSFPHSDRAKQALALLIVESGRKALALFKQSVQSGSPSYSDLKNAKNQSESAKALLPSMEAAQKLQADVQASLVSLVSNGQSELDAYKSALANSQPGYVHLENAVKFSEAVSGIDLNLPSGRKLQSDALQARNIYESTVRQASEAADGKQWLQSLKLLGAFRAFSEEDARVAKLIAVAYSGFYESAKQLDQAKDWKSSIEAYQNALTAQGTAEAREGLKNAKEQLLAVQNKSAADAALEKSKGFEAQHDLISAYEILASLPKSQKPLVTEDLQRLEANYITAASDKAKEIAKLYSVVGGIGDERVVENAYGYLGSAQELTEDEAAKQSFQSRMENLGDELSAWFLQRAKHCLQKPLGSGTELGWTYLKEAESYKAANLEDVRDQMKMAAVSHDMHSKLSIRAQFRDQTSQRQSEGFASQMENAIAAGLDGSGIPVKIVRSSDTTSTEAQPDFVIAGDVLEHNISAPPTEESIESKYIAGVHDVPNEQWNKINRLYNMATIELHTAQGSLSGTAKGNKKQIAEANKQVSDAQKKVDDLRLQLDSTPKTLSQDEIRPYRYRKTTYNVTDRIVLQFRIDDAISGQRGETAQISKEDRQQFVVQTDVMPSDVNNIRAEGTTPDKTELQTELENLAREELIKKVQDRVTDLPRKIYEDAQKRENEGYDDDAGEAYLRYLNVAPPEQVSEREQAEKFLKKQFNFLTFPSPIPLTKRPAPALEQSMATPKQ